MALSDMAVRKAKATGRAYTLGDIDGLSLAVKPANSFQAKFNFFGFFQPGDKKE